MAKEIVLYDGFAESLVKCIKGGWSEPEAEFMWSCEKLAFFEFSTDAIQLKKATNAKLNLIIMPYVSLPVLASQAVAIYCMGKRVKSLKTSHEHLVEIPFHYDPEFDPVLRLDFDFPDAVSPLDIGESADERSLGFRLFKLSVVV